MTHIKPTIFLYYTFSLPLYFFKIHKNWKQQKNMNKFFFGGIFSPVSWLSLVSASVLLPGNISLLLRCRCFYCKTSFNKIYDFWSAQSKCPFVYSVPLDNRERRENLLILVVKYVPSFTYVFSDFCHFIYIFKHCDMLDYWLFKLSGVKGAIKQIHYMVIPE